ncbi:hypothetical protein [Exiguobacterium flavidum]|uniref:hypothetical protein n=1 Tax=Exiguobacterium flavidum TaxID=2184695 RepID=UPI000DF81C2E|nr:hypothetical protein [Exiguobacterium flavidum]
MNLKKKIGVALCATAMIIGMGTAVAKPTKELPFEFSIKNVAAKELPFEFSVKQIAKELPFEFSIKNPTA